MCSYYIILQLDYTKNLPGLMGRLVQHVFCALCMHDVCDLQEKLLSKGIFIPLARIINKNNLFPLQNMQQNYVTSYTLQTQSPHTCSYFSVCAAANDYFHYLFI